MPILECYVDQATFDRLTHAANDLGRAVADLAECSIAESALNDARARHCNGERHHLLNLDSAS
jgi:hypothetical protein